MNMLCKFLYMKILFEYSKNTKYEKDMSNLLAAYVFGSLKLPQNYFNFTFFMMSQLCIKIQNLYQRIIKIIY